MGLLDDAIREHLELKRRRGADAVDISRQESEALGPVRRFPDGAPDLPDTFEPPQDDAPPLLTPDAPWEGEPTAAHSVLDDELPAAAHAPPPGVAGYEPPAPPAYAPPPAAERALEAVPEPEPEPEPEPAPPSEPAWRAYAPEPDPEPVARRREPEPPAYHEPEPESDPWSLGPDPDPEPDKPAGPPSRFSRLRIGRRSAKPAPMPEPVPEPAGEAYLDEEPPPRSSFAPPSAPAGFEPSSPYEPPPGPSYDRDPPAADHEPDIVPADDEGEAEDVLEETPDFLEETPEHDRLWFEQRPPRDFNFDD